jgi:hypothetical protein
MIADNPLALSYIFPTDVYLLANERVQFDQLTVPDEYPPLVEAELPTVNDPDLTVTVPIPDETIIAAEKPLPAAETNATTFKYKGAYLQKFLIIVHYPGLDVMEPAHFTALESTITRKDLSMDDVAIFNIAAYPGTELKTIGAFFRPKKMLLLGAETLPIGLVNPLFNQVTKLGKCDMLYSFSFADMMGNRENTKVYWEQMKLL